MNKNLIKLFTFCLFKKQAESCTKMSAKQTFKCEEYLQCDKKIINLTIFTISTNLYSTNGGCSRET